MKTSNLDGTTYPVGTLRDKRLYMVTRDGTAHEVGVKAWPGAFVMVGDEGLSSIGRRLFELEESYAGMVDAVWSTTGRLEFIAVEWWANTDATVIMMKRERFEARQLDEGLIRAEWGRFEWARYDKADGDAPGLGT